MLSSSHDTVLFLVSLWVPRLRLWYKMLHQAKDVSILCSGSTSFHPSPDEVKTNQLSIFTIQYERLIFFNFESYIFSKIKFEKSFIQGIFIHSLIRLNYNKYKITLSTLLNRLNSWFITMFTCCMALCICSSWFLWSFNADIA